jgi:ribosomal protein S17E
MQIQAQELIEKNLDLNEKSFETNKNIVGQKIL